MTAACAEAPLPRWRPRKHLWKLLGLTVVGTLVFSALSDWRSSHVFLINASESLPNWAFMIERGRMPARGDYVFFDPPQSPLLTRHFGTRPHPFGKIVYGIAGDIVTHDGSMVLVNGAVVARMKPRSRLGEALTPGATGAIPQGCFYAGSPHKDGFDSRYAEIGFICRRQILGTGVPVL